MVFGVYYTIIHLSYFLFSSFFCAIFRIWFQLIVFCRVHSPFFHINRLSQWWIVLPLSLESYSYWDLHGIFYQTIREPFFRNCLSRCRLSHWSFSSANVHVRLFFVLSFVDCEYVFYCYRQCSTLNVLFLICLFVKVNFILILPIICTHISWHSMLAFGTHCLFYSNA